MKYVLDANVALRFVLNEQHSNKARALREEFRQGLHEFLAPDFFPVEVANALTRAERRRAIPQGQARPLLDDIMTDCPILHDPVLILAKATDLSSQVRASVFDCLYFVLAEDQDCRFLTADRRILNIFRNEPRLIDLSSL